jgi:S-adenosylmethionine synthetase
LLQFGFVIGDERPVSLMVDTFGSGKLPEAARSLRIIESNFD